MKEDEYASAAWNGWNDDAVAMLRAMWKAGDSTAEIGRKVGCGKNGALSKAHRLGLPPREPPVQVARCIGEMPPFDPAWVTRYWSEEKLRRVMAAWAAGDSIVKIGRTVGISEWSVTRKTRVMGLPSRRVVALSAEQAPERRERDEYGADPLPAGHPITLAAIGMSYAEWVSAHAR